MILRLRCRSTLPLPFIPTTLPSRLAPRYFSSSLPLFQQPSSSTSNTTSSPTHPASSTIQSDTTLNPNPDAKVNADAAEPPLIDHSTNRYTATLKLLNVSEGVKIMQVGPDDGWLKEQKTLATRTGMKLVDQHILGEGSSDVSGLKEAIKSNLPYIITLSPSLPSAHLKAVMKTCMDEVVPVVVSHKSVGSGLSREIDTLISEQSMTRLIGPGCRMFILPHAGVYFSAVATDLQGQKWKGFRKGSIGVISYSRARSHLPSLLKAIKTSIPDAGFAAIVELEKHDKGGTRVWELVQWMLGNSGIEAICLLTRRADPITSEIYSQYLSSRPSNERSVPIFATGLEFPYQETNAAKWKEAGIVIEEKREDMIEKLKEALRKVREGKEDAAEVLGKEVEDVDVTDIKP